MEHSFPRLARLDLGKAVPNHLAGATGSAGRGGRGPARDSSESRFPKPRCSGAQVTGGVSRPRQPARHSARVRVCVCREHGPPRGRRSAGASPSHRRTRPVPVPGGGPSRRSAASPSPCASPAALPPPAGLQGSPARSSGQESAEIAHGGGRRRPGAGRPRWREARGDSAPSALSRWLPASRTPLAPTPSRRD